MNINTYIKNIDKLASVVANQKNCTDSFLASQQELKDKYNHAQEIISSNDISADEKAELKALISRLTDSLRVANSLHKQYLFAVSYFGIERVDNGKYRYRENTIEADTALSALDAVLEHKKIKDKYGYIHNLNSLEKHGLSMDDLVDATHLKAARLKGMALSEPWHFNCLLEGAKQIKARRKKAQLST